MSKCLNLLQNNLRQPHELNIKSQKDLFNSFKNNKMHILKRYLNQQLKCQKKIDDLLWPSMTFKIKVSFKGGGGAMMTPLPPPELG